MQADLPDYYERELGYLRQTAQEFAEKYPKIASRLVLGEKDNPDPHVERLLEGFAFLAARIHVKLDDDFPEISETLLNVVYVLVGVSALVFVPRLMEALHIRGAHPRGV